MSPNSTLASETAHVNLPCKQALKKQRTDNYNSGIANLFLKTSILNTKNTGRVNCTLSSSN